MSETVHVPERDGSKVATESCQTNMNALDGLLPLEKAWMLARLLPKSIPEAIKGDEIWEIGHINPETFVVTNCTKDRLEDWENIDPILN